MPKWPSHIAKPTAGRVTRAQKPRTFLKSVKNRSKTPAVHRYSYNSPLGMRHVGKTILRVRPAVRAPTKGV